MKLPEGAAFYLDDESDTVFVSVPNAGWATLGVDGSVRPSDYHPGRPPIAISAEQVVKILSGGTCAHRDAPENFVERAIRIALSAHASQVDRAGAPYILHALRVMLRMNTDVERIVAVLHDVLEDTPWTRKQLAGEGFSEKVLDALESVTRRTDESYDDFIVRAGRNPVARRVKLADLEDNSDLGRIANPTDDDRERVEKYRRAIELLRS